MLRRQHVGARGQGAWAAGIADRATVLAAALHWPAITVHGMLIEDQTRQQAGSAACLHALWSLLWLACSSGSNWPRCLGFFLYPLLLQVYYAASAGDAADGGFDDRVFYEEIAK